jgi:hypothetical protein
VSAVSPAVADEADRAGLERMLGQAAAVTAFVAGTVGLLYVIGGAVLWLRFHEADIPADRAVALVPKNDLLVLGLRVMVIPAVLSGLFLLALGSAWRARESRLEDLLREREENQRRLAAIHADSDEKEGDAESIKRRVDELEGKIRRRADPGAPGESLPRPRSNPLAFGILLFGAVAIALVVPFSVGAFAWPVVLTALLVYWWHLRPVRPNPKGSRVPIWKLALAAVLGAATISIARQTDRPVELVSVSAEVVDPPSLVTDTLKLTNKRVGPRHTVGEIGGILIAVRGSQLTIGDPGARVITSVPRSYVQAMTIGPPLDRRAPPRSLLSRIIGRSSWAVTPLELWCANVRYGWNRIGHACRGAPELHAAPSLVIDKNEVRGIGIDCPKAADEGCRGFVTLVTKTTGAAEEAPSTVLPVSIPPAAFALHEGVNDEVRISVDEVRLFELLRGQGGSHRRAIREPVRVLLTLEAAGDALVDEQLATLVVSAPPREKKPKKKGTKDPGGQPEQPGGAGGGGGPTGPSGPSKTTTPEPETSPEPEGTPTGANQMPPQDATLEAPTPQSAAEATP